MKSVGNLIVGCRHVVTRVSSLCAAKDFYHGILGIPILSESKEVLALRAGPIRLSFFEGFRRNKPSEVATGASIVLQTDDLQTVVKLLPDRNVSVSEIREAPGFCRFAVSHDPDGNKVEFAKYDRNPLEE